MSQFETLQDAANANTPESLDYYWANVDHDAYFNAARLHQYHEVIDYIDNGHFLLRGEWVMDACCGPGVFLKELCARFPYAKPYGIDYALSAVNDAKKRNPGALIFTTDLALLFPATLGRFDMVLCLQSLEHIANWKPALENLIAITEFNGNLIITIPNGELDTLPQHVNRWTFAEFHEILKPYGDVTMRYLGRYSRILGHVRKGE